MNSLGLSYGESDGREKGGSLEKWDKRMKSVGRKKNEKPPFRETILSRSVFWWMQMFWNREGSRNKPFGLSVPSLKVSRLMFAQKDPILTKAKFLHQCIYAFHTPNITQNQFLKICFISSWVSTLRCPQIGALQMQSNLLRFTIYTILYKMPITLIKCIRVVHCYILPFITSHWIASPPRKRGVPWKIKLN